MSRAFALVLLPLLVSGCGWLASFRPPAADDAPRLSHGALVRRVEAACAERTRALSALPPPNARAERGRFFSQVALIMRAEAEAIASLRPPSRDERELGRLLGASYELADVSDRFVVALIRRDAHERRRALADADRASAAYDRAAKRLGVACRQ